MNFAQQQRDPRKHLFGLTTVIIFHVVLVYALANGLARKVVDVIKDPLSVNIIEEIKPPPPPPPPPKIVQAQPKVNTPPPAYVPTVEVPVVAPAPAITTTNTPAPPAPPAPATPAPPAAINVAVACPNFRNFPPVMPPQAERQGLSGDVIIEFTVGADGSVKDVGIARSTSSIFNSAAIRAVSQYRCVGQGRDVRVKQQISFRVD